MQDFTSGNAGKKLLTFAVPFMISTVLQNLYTAADSVIVGRYVGESALAAVGTTTGISQLVLMLLSGATLGMSVVAGQFQGAGNKESLRRTVSTSIYLLLAASLFCGGLGIFLSRSLLRMTQVPEEILENAALYLRLIFLGSAATAMYNMANSLSRAMGDSVTPMIVLVITSILNIGMNILFVAVFGWGIAGVGAATVLATVLSAAASWIMLLIRMPEIRLSDKDWRPDGQIALLVARVGLPSALQSSSLSLGRLLMQAMVNGFGTTVIAAFSAATKLEAFISYVPGGITGGMQVLAAQNTGAGKLDRIHQGYRVASRAVIAYSLFSAAMMTGFGRPLVALFDPENTQMAAIGAQYLRYSAIGITFCGIMELSKSTLVGAGDTTASFLTTGLEMLVRLGSALLLSCVLGLGYPGIFAATPIGWIVGAAFSHCRYRMGRWERIRLIDRTPEQK